MSEEKQTEFSTEDLDVLDQEFQNLISGQSRLNPDDSNPATSH